MKKTKDSVFWIFLLLSLFSAVAGLMLYKLYDLGYLNKEGVSVPVYDDAPQFTLTERSGKTISSQDLKDKVWVAGFIFTRCGGQCPLTNAETDKLRKEMKDILFVSFTVDPDYDTPQILSDYADGYGSDLDNWIFLTGGKDMLNTVTTGFKMNRIDDSSMHSDRFVLVDKKSRVRGYYDVNDKESMSKLRRDIRIIKN